MTSGNGPFLLEQAQCMRTKISKTKSRGTLDVESEPGGEEGGEGEGENE